MAFWTPLCFSNGGSLKCFSVLKAEMANTGAVEVLGCSVWSENCEHLVKIELVQHHGTVHLNRPKSDFLEEMLQASIIKLLESIPH